MNTKIRFTPDEADVREALAEWMWSRRMFRDELSVSDALEYDRFVSALDWRVLGGVIPGPIPVEWVRVGDTISVNGIQGVVTRTSLHGGGLRSAPSMDVYLGSGHVMFTGVTQQDFVHVTASGN